MRPASVFLPAGDPSAKQQVRDAESPQNPRPMRHGDRLPKQETLAVGLPAPTHAADPPSRFRIVNSSPVKSNRRKRGSEIPINWDCAICGDTINSDRKTLGRHMARHMRDLPQFEGQRPPSLRCPECNSEFKSMRQSAVDRHLRLSCRGPAKQFNPRLVSSAPQRRRTKRKTTE